MYLNCLLTIYATIAKKNPYYLWYYKNSSIDTKNVAQQPKVSMTGTLTSRFDIIESVVLLICLASTVS